LKKKIYIIIILLLSTFIGISSQTVLSGNSYLFNPYLINPAYAGNYGYLNTSFQYIQTAQSITGAPKFVNLSIESPVYKTMSLGGRIYNQSEGLFNNFSANLDYAYKLKLNRRQFLSFGITAGFQSRQVEYSEIIAEDPTAIMDVASRNYEGLSFDAGAGFVYQIDKFELSLSAPQLFESKKNYGTIIRTMANYSFIARNGDIILKPALLADYNPNSPFFYDINITSYYKKQYFMGIAYRNSPGMVFSAGFVVKDLSLSYGIAFSLNSVSSVFNQVHEISISYGFRKLKPLQIDTLREPDINTITKIDSVNRNSDINLVQQENTTDSVNISNNEAVKPVYVIQEAGKGVYVIKQVSPDSIENGLDNLKYITEEQMEKLDKDSIIASKLLMEMETSRKVRNYEIVEVGDGLFTFQWKKGNNRESEASGFSEDMVDSLLVTDEVINNLGAKKQTITESDFYTIELLIDESNKSLLLDASIAMQTWFETDGSGNFKYFYGKYKTYDDAKNIQFQLMKNNNIKTEIIKL